MGGDSKGGGSNATVENSQASLANQLTSMLGMQQGESQQLFNMALPGLQQAGQFESALASGSPNLISSVIAPAAQQVQEATAGAKQNILNTAPAGGERNLAIEQSDVSQGSQLGALASQGYTSSFGALAQLGGQGIGESNNAASTAISAGSAANNVDSGLIQEHMQQKGSSLGVFGSLGGDVSSGLGGGIGASAGGAGAKGSIAAGLGAF